MLKLIPFSRKENSKQLLKNNENILWKLTKDSFFKKNKKGVENSKYYTGSFKLQNLSQKHSVTLTIIQMAIKE